MSVDWLFWLAKRVDNIDRMMDNRVDFTVSCEFELFFLIFLVAVEI